MNTKKYRWIFYFISITIIVTILIQFYWNYKNYESNKQVVKNEIQISFDNAIEEYYALLAKNNFITIVKAEDITILSDEKLTKDNKKPKFTINNIQFSTNDSLSKFEIDSLMDNAKKLVNKRMFKIDSSLKYTQFSDDENGKNFFNNGDSENIKYYKGKRAADSLKLIKNLKPIFISFLDNNLKYKKIDSLINVQLNNKGIDLKTNFVHLKRDTIFYKTVDLSEDKFQFSVDSKSTYLKENENFRLEFTNPNIEALKRSFFGIFISLILSLTIISCLFYLLKIIKEQKELSEIKNDLISNITHEFKTPIATVSTAIEALENFNVLDDKKKTKTYLSISSTQLNKLTQMVEKLLETATLDSDKLILKKENTDITDIIEKTVDKYKLINKDKSFIYSSIKNPLHLKIDIFHFENVISNLIDNAIKYGGDKIEININSILNSTEISVADNGNGINKNQQEKIFDKFYRVPKGNTHNVKGFGIGLYYCKKIIEKHGGNITLSSKPNKTIFKLSIPNE